MAKPETGLILSIHNQLPPKRQFHREKMWNALSAGTADVWYSGDRADLWVEYKWLVLPKRASTTIELGLSVLQRDWLRERSKEGRNVAVIAGYSAHGFKQAVVFRKLSWEREFVTADLIEVARPPKEIAQWLMCQCLNGSFTFSVRPIGASGM